MSQVRLTGDEIRFFQEVLNADYEICSIRLREGEYQFDLAKAIASFQLELYFPDVREIITRSYGEEKANDIKFRRKIQTILKKLEKNNVVRILPKKKPWELQQYALSSFKFKDVDNNPVTLATNQQIEKSQNLLNSILSRRERPTIKLNKNKTKISILVFIIIISYAVILWDLMQPIIAPIIFIFAFSIAVACSIMLGRLLSRE